MAGVTLEPIPHAEGIALLKGKPAVTRQVFNQLLPELKGLAFTITGVEAVDVLQRSRDLIAGLPQGRKWDDVKADLLSEISPWLVSGEDEEELAASGRAAERRAELLMRLHGFNAYEVAHSRVMEEMDDIFTHWRWQTMGDEKVRASHAAMDGITLPKDSKFWRTTWPRRGYMCRCQLVGITAEEAEEDLASDRTLDPEKRMYLEGSALRQLEEGGIINRGPSKQFNLSQEAASGPHRQFGSLRISPEDLRDRYDADVWAEFEKFAKAQEIEPGKTVWGWMAGLDSSAGQAAGQGVKAAAAGAAASAGATASASTAAAAAGAAGAGAGTTAAASATASAASSASVATGTPIAAAVDASGLVKSQQALVKEVTEAIGQVHGDGVLQMAKVEHKAGAAFGNYSPSISGKNDKLNYRRGDVGKTRGPFPHLTLTHEIGHWLDRRALPGTGYSSHGAMELEGWWNAVKASTHFSELTKAVAAGHKWPRYAVKRHELWARAYAQYIATESGNATLLDQLKIRQVRLGSKQYAEHWTDQDFAPIRDAMNQLFEKQGWRTPKAPAGGTSP